MLPDTDINLTPEQLDEMERASKLIPKIKAQIRKAKLAGLDVALQEAQLQTVEADLQKLQRVYGRSAPKSS